MLFGYPIVEHERCADPSCALCTIKGDVVFGKPLTSDEWRALSKNQMPETPDFEEIAQSLIHDAAMVVGALSAGTDCLPARRSIVEQLRAVWNARGAADIAKLEAEFHGCVTEIWVRGEYTLNLDRALRTLDR